MANVGPVGQALLEIAENVSQHIYCSLYREPSLEFQCHICNNNLTLEDVQLHNQHGPPFFCECRAKFWTIVAASEHIDPNGCGVCHHGECICDEEYLLPSWLFSPN